MNYDQTSIILICFGVSGGNIYPASSQGMFIWGKVVLNEELEESDTYQTGSSHAHFVASEQNMGKAGGGEVSLYQNSLLPLSEKNLEMSLVQNQDKCLSEEPLSSLKWNSIHINDFPTILEYMNQKYT